MSKILIDNKEYNLDELSTDVKDNLVSLKLVDDELNRLKMQLAITTTARNAYASQLREKLGSQNS